MTNEEQNFLQTYDISKYARPSLATDIVLFSLSRNNNNIRNIDINGLQVLLIKRALPPFKDKWALPGGFCIPTENILQTAKRELFEETGVPDAFLQLVGTYSEKDRDPRGWIISNAYMGMIHQEDCHLRADTDAWEAAWFTVTDFKSRITKSDGVTIEIIHQFALYNHDTNEKLYSYFFEIRTLHKTYTETAFRLHKSDLAFDHGQIIGETILNVKQTIQHDIRLLFNLFPEKFTIGELRMAYEIILDQPVHNFRRMVNPYVIETNEVEKAGYRPAKLYVRNPSVFMIDEK